MDEKVVSKAKKIKLLLLDVDGVLTDGRIIYDSKGRDSKFFDVHDGSLAKGGYWLRKSRARKRHAIGSLWVAMRNASRATSSVTPASS